MAEMTLRQAMDYAAQLHRAGRAAEAEGVYRQILNVDPRNSPALQMLARLYYETCRHAEAAETLRRVTAVEPNNADVLSNLGSVLAGMGRLDEAADALRKAVELRPNSAGTCGNLANILLAKGQVDDAIDAYRKALAVEPNAPEVVSNLGNALRQKGDIDGAIESFRRAVELRPEFVEARINLAHALKESGKLDEAVEGYRKALEVRPEMVDGYVALGNTLQKAGRDAEAIESYRRAISLRPDTAEAWYGMGGALKHKGETDHAIAAYREAVRIRPTYADAYSNLGIALNEKGLVAESIAAYQSAIKHLPQSAEAYNNLGITLRNAGRPDEAVVALKQALSIRPDYPEALNNIALAYEELGDVEASIASYQKALRLRPNFDYAQNNLANALKEAGRLDEAIATYREAAEYSTHPWVLGNLLFALHAHPDFGPAELYREHRKWNERFAKPLESLRKPHENDPSPDRRLRVGFVSPDLNQHPVGRFMMPLMQNLDRKQVEVFCYSDGRRVDWMAAEFERLADTWRKTLGMTDERVADLVRTDRIDILIDLTMHTKDSRLSVFAMKPAPVQATYLAYCGTTGVDAIDYRISDPYLDPPGTDERFYAEKTVRLPHSYWCYQAAPESGEVMPLPSATSGTITFGSLNVFSKVTPQAIATWGKILVNTPGSRMVLHSKEGTHRERALELFRQAGVEAGRVRFVPRISGRDYFNLYGEIDVGLDPFPYPGGTTTCDALYMGVPVVTLKDRTAVSRGGFSILSNLGLRELVAESVDQYVELACALARDQGRLANLRSTLRGRMQSSPLMDASAFARGFEGVLGEAWREWCDSATRPSRK